MIQNLQTNWVRWTYAVLGGILAVATAIATGAVTVPPPLKDVAPWAGVVVVFLGFLLPNAFDQGKPLPPEPPPATVPHG